MIIQHEDQELIERAIDEMMHMHLTHDIDSAEQNEIIAEMIWQELGSNVQE